jgi:hypothetical protein
VKKKKFFRLPKRKHAHAKNIFLFQRRKMMFFVSLNFRAASQAFRADADRERTRFQDRSSFLAMITVSAPPGYFPGPARTRCRSNSFPARENSPGGPSLDHSGLTETRI